MAAELRLLRQRVEQIEKGELEIDHTWGYHVAIAMRRCYLWYDTDEWKKAHKVEKILHVSLFLVIFLLWWLLVARVIQDFAVLSVSRIAEGISLSMGGVLTFSSFCIFFFKREDLTTVIRTVDIKVRAVPRNSERHLKWWDEMTKNYVLEIKVLGTCLFAGLFICGPGILYALYSGQLTYDTVIPLSVESYTWQWWIQYLYQALDPIISGIFFSFKEFMMISPIYYLAVLFQLQAENTLELCSTANFDPEVELRKLVGILREVSEITELAQIIKDLVSPYLLIVFSMSYLILSIAGLCILIESKDGWFEAIARSITYPSYFMGILVIWTYLGEYFTDTVNRLDESLYNCNWIDGNMQMKKLILIYRIRLSQPNYIEGGPFFVSNLELFAEILKKTYYLLAILVDFLE